MRLLDDVESALGHVDTDASPVWNSVRSSSSHQLSGQSMHLWVLQGADAAVGELASSVLDGDEVRRASLMTRGGDRTRYVFSHVALRHLLGHALDIAPHEVVYVREPCPSCGGPNGRPALHRAPRPLHFSLSTSSDLTLVGIATAPVGVDVQAVSRSSVVSHVRSLLHPAERADIDCAAASERPVVFTRLWARKEAYLKGVGVGVAHGLEIEYLGSENGAAGPRGWSVLDAAVPGGFAAAAAVRTG